MKSIFQKPIYKKEYYLRTESIYTFSWDTRYYPKESISDSNERLAIFICSRFFEYINILETDQFTEKFSKDDKVCIENEVYTIDEVIYGVDTYIYRLKEYELIDDEQSKNKAMTDYENRLQEQKKEELHKVASEVGDVVSKELSKKWRQFWKIRR